NRSADTAARHAVWQQAQRLIREDRVDLVALDELTYMAKFGYLPLEGVMTALENRPPEQPVIVTARQANREVGARADPVTAMTK
ncbi:cob(I)yrinic acid a,c-diamide adenosyltransferase, partial [Cobetia sp. SIMBA_158]|uniref:cob(I)yrinic acid a,c-diamide adenosyltransferase n=1 Tax=Cobetia sp. SIMBA_158 TaxID=3081617 RepID=UPI00397F20E7